MDEYIKREAALNICQKEYEERLKMHDYCGDSVAWNIGGAIKSLPAADVAPVVRCRECSKYMTQECLLCSFDKDGTCTGGPDSDFYCADSRHRDDYACARMDGGEENADKSMA